MSNNNDHMPEEMYMKNIPNKEKENFCYAPMQKNYMMEAEKLLPEKIIKLMNDRKISSATYPNGYNQARDEDTPIVADLLKQIDELKGKK